MHNTEHGTHDEVIETNPDTSYEDWCGEFKPARRAKGGTHGQA
jgi:hypothetical protein